MDICRAAKDPRKKTSPHAHLQEGRIHLIKWIPERERLGGEAIDEMGTCQDRLTPVAPWYIVVQQKSAGHRGYVSDSTLGHSILLGGGDTGEFM